MGFLMMEKVLEIWRGEGLSGPLGEGLELKELVRTHGFREREREPGSTSTPRSGSMYH